MYSIFKNVISSGNYELSSMLRKIDVQWIQGSLTDDERAELITLAQNTAKIQNSVDILKKLEEFDKRLMALEKANAESGSEDDTETGDSSSTEPDEFVVGKWYYAGDTITFEGKQYTCTAPEGQVCVWSPTDYPAYWRLVE